MTEQLTHHKKLSNPLFIGAYSLRTDEERIVTIKKVFQGKAFDPVAGKEKDCVIAELVNEKPMILNATNRATISKLMDSPYIEKWIGKSITIFATKILDKRTKEMIECLRIKPSLPNSENKINQEQEQKKQKDILTKEMLNKAIEKIGAGEYSKEKLINRYVVSKEQEKEVDDYISSLVGSDLPMES